MHARSWRWLRVRILGLLDAPPLIVPGPEGTFRSMHSTRLGLALFPPKSNDSE